MDHKCNPTAMEKIAVLGMSCRFPGAANLSALATLLTSGGSAITTRGADRWGGFWRPDEDWGLAVETAGFLDGDVWAFDWSAFGIGPKEARFIDPQHRLLMEVTGEAIDDAGFRLEDIAGTRTGVFVAVGWSDHGHQVMSDIDTVDAYVAPGTRSASAANRISHIFDLRGPSFSVDSMCSSSLVAVHLAAESLRQRECETAIVGGVNLILDPRMGLSMARGGFLASDGACFSLDERARGMVRGEGAGVVVLRRASDVGPDDRVYANLCATGVQHNGRAAWYMAPRADAQKSLMVEVAARAGLHPSRYDYVELHAAGFAKGDAVEVRTLRDLVAERPRSSACRLGTVKPTFGNLEAGGGVASFIKVCLSAYRKEFYPVAGFQTLHSDLRIPSDVLSVQHRFESREGDEPCIFAINAFALGGMNAHVVLESTCSETTTASDDDDLFVVTGRTNSALRRNVAAMTEWVDGSSNLHDLCFTSRQRRTLHRHRLVVRARSVAELRDGLRFALQLGEQGEMPGVVGAEDCGRLELAARRLATGEDVDLDELQLPRGKVVSLPPYAWERVSLRAETRAAAPERRFGAAREILTIRDAEAVVRSALAEATGLERVARDARFFELGLSSIAAVKVAQRLGEKLGLPLSGTTLLDYPDIQRLTDQVWQLVGAKAVAAQDRPTPPEDPDIRALYELPESEAEAILLSRLQALVVD